MQVVVRVTDEGLERNSTDHLELLFNDVYFAGILTSSPQSLNALSPIAQPCTMNPQPSNLNLESQTLTSNSDTEPKP